MNEPTLPDLDDDDFSDLDAIIADAEADRAAKHALAAKKKRVAVRGISEDERFAILAEIRRAEDAIVWRTTTAVALFHSQHCLSCGHEHRFFMGWMALQQHKTDPTCRRYIRGRPEAVPARVETHAQPGVDLCADCAEGQLIIEESLASARLEADRAALEPHRPLTQEDREAA